MLPFPRERWHLYWNPSRLSTTGHTCTKWLCRHIPCHVQQHLLPSISSLRPFSSMELLARKRNFWPTSSVLRILYTPTRPLLACLLSGLKNSETASLLLEPFHRSPCTALVEQPGDSHNNASEASKLTPRFMIRLPSINISDTDGCGSSTRVSHFYIMYSSRNRLLTDFLIK